MLTMHNHFLCFLLPFFFVQNRGAYYKWARIIHESIRYTKTINSTASLVVAISNIQKMYNAGEYYKIQFVTCSAKTVERVERKKIMKNERQKQNYEAMEPSKKRTLLEKNEQGILQIDLNY